MKAKLLELVRAGADSAEISATLKKLHAVHIAEAFSNLETDQALTLFRLIPEKLVTDVFPEITAEMQIKIVEGLTDSEQSALLNGLFADDAAALVEKLPPQLRKKILHGAEPSVKDDINYLLKFHSGSPGRIMTTEYLRLGAEETAEQAIKFIREHGANKRVIYTCFVTDSQKTLVGFVSVKEILLASPKTKISAIMDANVISIGTHDSLETVAATFKKFGYMAIPVIDSGRKLVGVVTMDDAMAVIESEHTKDLAVNAAVTPSGLPYLQTGVLHHSRNRIVWLLFLMVSAMFTGGIISAFETQLAAVTALIAFIPMLMDTGGNAGSQTSTLVIRGMALGEISGRDVLKVWWKEVRIALVCGLVLGIVNFVRIIVIDGFLRAGGLGDQIIRISTVVSLTLCCTLVLAKSLGCLLPILAKRFRLDPAIMAAPLITTIADALSLLTYFGIASILLGL